MNINHKSTHLLFQLHDYRFFISFSQQCTDNQLYTTKLDMLNAGMFLQAHFPASYKLVAEVLQRLSPAALTLLLSLALAHFSIVQSADVIALFLLVLLLLLGL